MGTFTVIRSADRDIWRDSAVISRQSFPATGSFDLEANAFGLLMVHNDDIVSPGEGFDMHFHIKWPLHESLTCRRGLQIEKPTRYFQRDRTYDFDVHH
ncbi:hypothetical protein HMPREF0290_0617 [Corynebacterium efficiens YS-314]|uniref:hypothetical protein n=1 Tax=Corynebacterium efficiens TaxID=152794 RepID=UPI0001B86BAA|nr:hypothetical protein HMPREF0290_0617 [Corynebacterium efficiens YS-314]